MVRTGATFATACDDWLAYKRDRKVKLSTQIDYEHMVDRMKKVFGEKFGQKVRLEDVTPETVEGFRDALVEEGLSDRTVNKYLTVLHGIFVWAQRRYKLPANPVANVERRPHAKRGNIDVFSREEVLALGSSRRFRAGRHDLPHGRVHRPAPRRAAGAALARRGFRQQRDPRPAELHQRARRHAQERPGAHGANGRRGCRSAGKARPARPLPRATTISSSAAPGGHSAGHRLRGPLQGGAHEGRVCASCASTTCATPSARTRSAPPTRARSWSGWATQDLATTQRYLAFKPRQDAARRVSAAFRWRSRSVAGIAAGD